MQQNDSVQAAAAAAAGGGQQHCSLTTATEAVLLAGSQIATAVAAASALPPPVDGGWSALQRRVPPGKQCIHTSPSGKTVSNHCVGKQCSSKLNSDALLFSTIDTIVKDGWELGCFFFTGSYTQYGRIGKYTVFVYKYKDHYMTAIIALKIIKGRAVAVLQGQELIPFSTASQTGLRQIWQISSRVAAANIAAAEIKIACSRLRMRFVVSMKTSMRADV
jgi:hypothetical protein